MNPPQKEAFMVKKTVTILSILALVAMISSVVKADTVTLNLTNSNASPSNPWTTTPPGGSFGTVTLTLLAGGNIQVSVQLVAGYFFIQDSLAWNWGGSGPAPTIAVTGLTSGYSLADGGVPRTGNPPLQMDGFGNFLYGINGPNWGSGGTVNALSFTITGSYTSVNQFVGANGGGYTFAAHIYDVNSEATNKTGYVSTGVSVPEPGSLTLLLLGAGALLLGGRWKK